MEAFRLLAKKAKGFISNGKQNRMLDVIDILVTKICSRLLKGR